MINFGFHKTVRCSQMQQALLDFNSRHREA